MTSRDRQRFPVVTILLLVLGLFALAMGQNNPASQKAPPADALNRLLSGQGQAIISQPVTLHNVAIQDLTQDDIVWVGTSPTRSVMVMLQPSVNPMDPQGNPTPIAPGDPVQITGHVLRAPNTQVLESWGSRRLTPRACGRRGSFCRR